MSIWVPFLSGKHFWNTSSLRENCRNFVCQLQTGFHGWECFTFYSCYTNGSVKGFILCKFNTSFDDYMFCQTTSIHYLNQLWSNSVMVHDILWPQWVNTLRPRQNGCHFTDDSFNCIFLNENALISIEISLKFFPMGPVNNIPELVQIIAWRRSGNKPLSEPMMVSLVTHICVTRPQWVKKNRHVGYGNRNISVLWN